MKLFRAQSATKEGKTRHRSVPPANVGLAFVKELHLENAAGICISCPGSKGDGDTGLTSHSTCRGDKHLRASERHRENQKNQQAP